MSAVDSESIRLARFLAACGVGSRRGCEGEIRRGTVSVNGTVVYTPACVVDPRVDIVCWRGSRVVPGEAVYIALYKPPGVTCSLSDPHASRLVSRLLPAAFGRLFPVGRLDRDSEGLLLMTNDGACAQRVAHPSYGVRKVYLVDCQGGLAPKELARLKRGIVDRGEFLKPRSVHRVKIWRGGLRLKFVLVQGRKREVRRLCAAVGLTVTRLLRISIGGLRLGTLKPGQWRRLSPVEAAALFPLPGKSPQSAQEV